MISSVIEFILLVGANNVMAIAGPVLLVIAAGYLGAALGARHLAWLLVCAAAVWFATAEVYQAGVANTLAAVHRAEQAERQRQEAETALALASDRERARMDADADRAAADLAGRVEADQEAQARLDTAASSAAKAGAIPGAPLVTKAIHDQLEAIR